jgi:hypothetical protein
MRVRVLGAALWQTLALAVQREAERAMFEPGGDNV